MTCWFSFIELYFVTQARLWQPYSRRNSKYFQEISFTKSSSNNDRNIQLIKILVNSLSNLQQSKNTALKIPRNGGTNKPALWDQHLSLQFFYTSYQSNRKMSIKSLNVSLLSDGLKYSELVLLSLVIWKNFFYFGNFLLIIKSLYILNIMFEFVLAYLEAQGPVLNNHHLNCCFARY